MILSLKPYQLIMDNNLKIKGPEFKPKPGWGGKLKVWFASNFAPKVLPALSIAVLIIGVYSILNKNKGSGNKPTSQLEFDIESEVIEKIAQPRQGLTHLARAALAEFIESKGVELKPEQKLFAETYLVTKLKNRLVNPGDTVAFHINDLSESIEKAQLLNDYQLRRWRSYLRK